MKQPVLVTLSLLALVGDQSKEISRLCRLAAASGLCLAVAGNPALGAEHKYDGVYTGNKLLTKGSGPKCSVEEDVSVTIHDQTLTFTDLNFRIVVLDFYPRQDGSFGLVYVDAGRATVNIRGHVIGDVLEADVNSPPCEYHWHLKKK